MRYVGSWKPVTHDEGNDLPPITPATTTDSYCRFAAPGVKILHGTQHHAGGIASARRNRPQHLEPPCDFTVRLTDFIHWALCCRYFVIPGKLPHFFKRDEQQQRTTTYSTAAIQAIEAQKGNMSSFSRYDTTSVSTTTPFMADPLSLFPLGATDGLSRQIHRCHPLPARYFFHEDSRYP